MTETKNKGLNPVKLMLLVFVLLTAFFLIFKAYIIGAGMEPNILLIGNLILFLIGLYTVNSSMKAIDNPKPHVFVRVFYAGFIIRLFVCALAAFVYIYLNDGKVNKFSLFACLGIYILYSVIEVSTLKKALRENKNG